VTDGARDPAGGPAGQQDGSSPAPVAPPAGRIFLVGTPRSGTTLLQALLAAHEQVTSFTESHFFSRPFTTLPGLGTVLRHDPTARVAGFLAENQAATPPSARWFESAAALPLRLPPVRPFYTRSVARRLVRVLDELAAARGAPVWLEKTPRHLHRLDLLEDSCRDGVPTRFVHLIRGGLDTVASLLDASRHWERAYPLDTCIARWNGDLALTAAALDRPAHHAVCYERLTEDPERVLGPLLAALDLPWTSRLLDDYASMAERLTGPGEHWKRGTARPIRAASKAERVLDEAQRGVVRAKLDSALYETLAAQSLGARHDGSGR